MTKVTIRPYKPLDLEHVTEIWNEVVDAGNAFPQEEMLRSIAAQSFFESQSMCGVALVDDEILGLYILHPNNVGRCSHIANGSYAVSSRARGKGVGRKLVEDSLACCKELGFNGLQFNAVVESNWVARALYEELGFIHVGCVPQGFRMKDGSYENTHIYFHAVT